MVVHKSSKAMVSKLGLCHPNNYMGVSHSEAFISPPKRALIAIKHRSEHQHMVKDFSSVVAGKSSLMQLDGPDLDAVIRIDVPVMRTSKHGESNTSVLEDPTL
ncbi:hypothetical protein Tco_1146818 [Tanacetum coccineum]